MTDSSSTMTGHAAAVGLDPILDRLLRAIHLNRQPGFSFAGDMLDLAYEILPGGARMVLSPGALVTDAEGIIDPLCFGAFVDIAVARAIRAVAGYPARMATSLINLRLNGAPLKGRIVASGTFEGWSVGTEGRLATGRVELTGPEGPIGWATGQFPALGGADMVVRYSNAQDVAPLSPGELKGHEPAIFAMARDALQRSQSKGTSFIAEFWGVETVATDNGARSTFRNGPHADNLVRHLQGGLQLGLAEITAARALGPDWLMTSLNACYLRPGIGAEFITTTEIVHRGRTTAVAVNRVRDETGRTVLETTSTHAKRV